MERDPFADIPLAELRLLDAICSRFEASCRRGDAPRVEDFLNEMDGPARDKLAREILHLEVEYRRQRGELPTRVEYAERFPEFRAITASLFDSSLIDAAVTADYVPDVGRPKRPQWSEFAASDR